MHWIHPRGTCTDSHLQPIYTIKLVEVHPPTQSCCDWNSPAHSHFYLHLMHESSFLSWSTSLHWRSLRKCSATPLRMLCCGDGWSTTGLVCTWNTHTPHYSKAVGGLARERYAFSHLRVYPWGMLLRGWWLCPLRNHVLPRVRCVFEASFTCVCSQILLIFFYSMFWISSHRTTLRTIIFTDNVHSVSGKLKFWSGITAVQWRCFSLRTCHQKLSVANKLLPT